MGIKHLDLVENLLKRSKLGLTKSQIRSSLNIDFGTLNEAIDYLIKNKKIKKNPKKIAQAETYLWIGE